MTKAIIVAVGDYANGYGDFLFALKLCDQLQRKIALRGIAAQPIHLVTSEWGKKTIAKLDGDLEFGVSLLTSTELQESIEAGHIDVGLVLEGPIFDNDFLGKIDTAVASLGTPIPLIMLPEYGYNAYYQRSLVNDDKKIRKTDFPHLKYKNTIYSGFDSAMEECGILLSDVLAKPKDPTLWLAQCDAKIRNVMLGTTDPATYLKTHEISLEYSHDYKDDDTEAGNTATQFLKTQREFAKASHKNQDIVMVGDDARTKLSALRAIKNQLISDGYSTISFHNKHASSPELILHHVEKEDGGKAYRVFFASRVSHPSMIALIALSGPLVGVTGDQSFGEAVSANKFIIYECLGHKMELIRNYDEAIVYSINCTSRIAELVDLLRTPKTNDDYEKLGALMRDPHNQRKFEELNRHVIEELDFAERVLDACLTHSIPTLSKNAASSKKDEGAIDSITGMSHDAVCPILDTRVIHSPPVLFSDTEGSTMSSEAIDLVEKNHAAATTKTAFDTVTLNLLTGATTPIDKPPSPLTTLSFFTLKREHEGETTSVTRDFDSDKMLASMVHSPSSDGIELLLYSPDEVPKKKIRL